MMFTKEEKELLQGLVEEEVYRNKLFLKRPTIQSKGEIDVDAEMTIARCMIILEKINKQTYVVPMLPCKIKMEDIK